MGQLVEGNWTSDDAAARHRDGRYVRATTQFRNWITPDGSPGVSGTGGYEAEAGRYHLYVSSACPWAHRTILYRKIKGLENLVGMSVVSPRALETGWDFTDGLVDHLYGSNHLYEIYAKSDPAYSGRVSVPVLWDKAQNRIVNNESAEIIRMLNSAFDHLGAASGDYYPAEHRAAIDAINERIYQTVNNGVYRAGFARSQEAYEEAVKELFHTLEFLEQHLSGQRYLVSDQLTEADWRLFTTLIRFDAVYNGHFKCNLRRIADFTHLPAYLRDLYQVPGVAETVDLDHIKVHYYFSQESINPTRIIPIGPELDFSAPHGRDRYSNANNAA